jgi:hypothetical protein
MKRVWVVASYIVPKAIGASLNDGGLHSPSKKLRSCALRPPVPLTGGGGGGGVAFAFDFMPGKLMFFPASLPMSNVSGDGSGTICGAGGAFAGDAILKPLLGGGSRGTGVEDFDDVDLDLFMIAVGRGDGDKVLRAGADIPI